MTAAAEPAHQVPRAGPWLWGPRVDLGVFGGSALFALALVALAPRLGIGDDLPEWGWLLFVLGVDVAHVWATLFRTYLDGEELRRHRARYLLLPVVVYALGVAIHAAGSLIFWRALAYVAVFHFIRQQVGWVAVYRARAWGPAGDEESERERRVDRWVDDAAVYLATLYPLTWWHAHLAETPIAWFVQGDFVDVAALATQVLPLVRALWLAALVAYALRQLVLWRRSGRVQLGKTVVVGATTLTWHAGIVAVGTDFAFSVTNVLCHGVPYVALLWFYARARQRHAPEALGSRVVTGGLGAFLGVMLLLAFSEELAWDWLVWGQRGWLFGKRGALLDHGWQTWIVPLLSLPQATHYALDGLLWRRGDTRANAAQREALGF